ncbi:MAG: hypothetical protein IJD10_01640 [Clostridia bacterium]|nr:hypothetical protein [Clostridia bacterium]
MIQELHLSHGKVLDGKAVRAHLKDVIDSFGGTVKVQEIENDFSDLYEYLYNKKRIVRDEKGNFLRLEKVAEVEPSVCETMLNRIAEKTYGSQEKVASQNDTSQEAAEATKTEETAEEGESLEGGSRLLGGERRAFGEVVGV